MICRKCHLEVPDGAFCLSCGAKQEVAKRSKRGNGQGYVFKRGKSWYAQVTLYGYEENGKHKQRRKTKGGFTTKKDALDYISTLKTAEVRIAPKLIDLYQSFESHELPSLSASKKSAYKKARERIDALMGFSIDKLTVQKMQEVIDTNCKSFYTAHDCKNLLSKLYQKALPDGFVTQNLALFLKEPELQEEEPVPFTEKEVDTMWKAYADGEIFVGYMLLMIYSGMMPAELLSCRKDMIDLDKCEIYGCGRKTKTRKQNAIVFADCVRPVVEELMKLESANGRADKGKLVQQNKDNFYLEYHATLQRIGVRDLPPYSCRHTTGTEAARQNLNASIVQKIMRHAKITTSQKYIHLGSEDAHAGVNVLPASTIL